ncbi:aminotransferase class IV [Microbispora sp. RL4-1S]|uniref:Aminotransferase class IV n=1 Tax=Microbispora oryzae TaxID=2806554 RepID=A0A940WQ42_9ACTN|nr:aminotransferase class IV [Microbispora oryzae]MBP2705465.1 aminotransferase class IV [Microbispora oryzae]
MSVGYSVVYHDGHYVPSAAAVLPVGSIALRYAVSVFEGVRLYAGAHGAVTAWLLDQHLERLRNSCRIMGLDDDECAEVPRILRHLVEVNEVTGDSYVRIAVSAGNAGGIDAAAEPVLTVTVTPSGRKRWLADDTGMRLTISGWSRPGPATFPNEAKNISAYAGPRLALAEARRDGYDNCLLLTVDGLVSEAPTATVFLVEGDRLVTPRLADAVLPSVTRAWVLATAADLGLSAAEEAVTPDRVRAADEVFLCGTGIEFGPVREVDGAAVGSWPRRPVTARLVEEHFAQARGHKPATHVVLGLEGVHR